MKILFSTCLLKQTFKDFEWLIINDSSTDDTDIVVQSFIQENNIDYTYGQTKMTLLYKEKTNKITGESEIQYDRLSGR